MSAEVSAATRLDIDNYFKTLRTSLAGVPELKVGLDYTKKEPEFATGVYLGYVALYGHIAELSEGDRQASRDAKAWMLGHEGTFGTASEVSADDLLAELDGHADVMRKLALSSASSASTYFKPAMAELVRRMEGGHDLSANGGNPRDGDPESGKVIWGHTMMPDPPNPQSLVHFMVAHYMERYFAVGLTDAGSELASQKDFLLNALIDVVILDHLGANRFADIYDVWRKTKEEDGLGWINDDRLRSYEHRG